MPTDLHQDLVRAIDKIIDIAHHRVIESINTAIASTDFEIIEYGSLQQSGEHKFSLTELVISNEEIIIKIDNTTSIKNFITAEYWIKNHQRVIDYESRHQKKFTKKGPELYPLYVNYLGYAMFNSLKDLEYNLLNFLRICVGKTKISEDPILGCDKCEELKLYKFCFPQTKCEVKCQTI